MRVGLGFVLLITAAFGLSADAARPDLAGVVKSSKGEALKDATVFIYTAGPKEGAGILCPSCYADCRKRATTDAQGKFTIEDLDPALLFQILVVGPGHQPEFVSKVDPADGALDVKLKEVSGGDTPDKQLRGRVVDSKGNPISGAVINIRGVTRGQSTRFGGNKDVDPVAVSDANGNFLIRSTNPFDAVGVDVEAGLFAKGVFQSLATGGKVHQLRLSEGSSIKGRLVNGGKRVAGVQVGVAGAERRSEIFVGDYVVGTDKDGRFLFVNLPPRTRMYAYGIKKTLGKLGALPTRLITTADDGSELDLGDLNLERGYTVAGEVRLTDGKPIPERTRILLGSDKAWDATQTDVDEQGRFRFEGVPAETVELSIRVKGYRLSARNASLDLMNPFHLEGRVQTNITDMIMELEPGDRDPNARPNSYVSLAEEPLRGAEKRKVEGEIKVTGTVNDQETGKPIAQFTLTPGRGRGPDFDWLTIKRETHKDGTFEMFFAKQNQAPAVLIEAEGYIPLMSGPVPSKGTNMVIALKKGSGPSGILLTPDGEPARGVKVFLTDMRNSVYVSGERAEVNERIGRGLPSTQTDDTGRFSFPAQADAFSLVVVDDAGFMDVPVATLEENTRLTLQRWARVEGELLIGKRSGSNETVRLGSAHLPYEHHPRNFPPISLFLTTKTDDRGRFAFDRVPPRAVEVYHEPKVRDSRNGTIAQAQTIKFLLTAGETRRLTLGGKGRPVIGRVEVKGYDREINWRRDVHRLETVVPEPEGLPDRQSVSREYGDAVKKASTDEEKKAARADFDRRQEALNKEMRNFYASEAGRNYLFAKRRFALNFAQDGSFRVEDVPAGKYTLNIDLREGDGTSRLSSPRIAQSQKEVEVPDSGAERSDEAYDLGTIELQARPVLTKGKAAPEFEVKTLDDRTIKLSDFRGKYVLVDFWAVWCGPCVAETPHLKETYEAFKDDSRFAMIGLSLDPERKAPIDYAKKNSLGWIQAFLGEWSKTDLPLRYGVEGIPSIFLIGPDGNIVASGLRGPNIKSTVQSALRTPTAQK